MTGLGDLLPRPGDAFGGFRDVTGAAGVDAVREGERQVRSLLGMAPQVYELGETENPRDLVPGNPGEIEESVAGLTKLGDALARTGDAFARIDVGEWHGKAAQSFRRYFTNDAPRWHAAGEAFHQAAAALRQYREALEQAQRDAAEAIRLYREGEQASEAAREAYNRQVDAYNRAVQAATASSGPAPTPPGPFTDPGQHLREQAQRILHTAREHLRQAGDQAAGLVRQATVAAPAEPGLLSRLAMSATDLVRMGHSFQESVLKGAAESVESMIKMVRTVNPLDPYNLTHPAQALQNSAALAAGLVHAVAEPKETIKGALQWDTWGKDPGAAVGSLIPDLVGSAFTGGGAAAASTAARTVARTAVREGMEQAAETAARQAATEAAEHAAARAAQEAAEQAAATAGRQTATDVAASAGRQAATDVAAGGTGIRDALAAADQQAAAGLRESGATLANAEAKLDNLNLRSGAVEAPSATSVLERTPASESPPALYTPEDYDKWRAKVEEASPRHEEPLSRPAEQQPGHETSTGESNHDRTVEKTELPERPQRPEKIDSEYLNRYFEYYDELDRRGIKLLHPGTEHPTFEPGGELPEGLTRIPPKDITEGSVRHVRPEDVYAGERYNSDIEDFEKRPVVWRYNENPLDEPLYRRVTVDPELIISKGMDVGDPKMLDLHRHQGNLTWEQSGLSSWTRSPEYAADFEREIFNPKRAMQLPDGTYMQVDYIWKGYHRGGIDMDATWHDLRELNPYHEGEVTIPGGVRTEQLEGYWPRITIYTPEGQIVKTTFGDFVPNPNFKIEALIK